MAQVVHEESSWPCTIINIPGQLDPSDMFQSKTVNTVDHLDREMLRAGNYVISMQYNSFFSSKCKTIKQISPARYQRIHAPKVLDSPVPDATAKE